MKPSRLPRNLGRWASKAGSTHILVFLEKQTLNLLEAECPCKLHQDSGSDWLFRTPGLWSPKKLLLDWESLAGWAWSTRLTTGALSVSSCPPPLHGPSSWPSWQLLGSPPPSLWDSVLMSHCQFCKAPLLSPAQIFQEYLSTLLSTPQISIHHNFVFHTSCGLDCSFIICHPQVKEWPTCHPFSPQNRFLISPPMTVGRYPEGTLSLPSIMSPACLEM